jgi:hypothetical protein
MSILGFDNYVVLVFTILGYNFYFFSTLMNGCSCHTFKRNKYNRYGVHILDSEILLIDVKQEGIKSIHNGLIIMKLITSSFS